MKDEPVSAAGWLHVLAGIISMLAAKYLPAMGLTDEQALAAAGILFTIATRLLSRFTRAKVMSMTKIEERLAADHPVAFAALKRPS